MSKQQDFVNAFVTNLAADGVELNSGLEGVLTKILAKQVTIKDGVATISSYFVALGKVFTFVATSVKGEGCPAKLTDYTPEAVDNAIGAAAIASGVRSVVVKPNRKGIKRVLAAAVIAVNEMPRLEPVDAKIASEAANVLKQWINVVKAEQAAAAVIAAEEAVLSKAANKLANKAASKTACRALVTAQMMISKVVEANIVAADYLALVVDAESAVEGVNVAAEAVELAVDATEMVKFAQDTVALLTRVKPEDANLLAYIENAGQAAINETFMGVRKAFARQAEVDPKGALVVAAMLAVNEVDMAGAYLVAANAEVELALKDVSTLQLAHYANDAAEAATAEAEAFDDAVVRAKEAIALVEDAGIEDADIDDVMVLVEANAAAVTAAGTNAIAAAAALENAILLLRKQRRLH